MASILCSSQGVVLATAMALSGTVILLAFRLQKSLPIDHIPQFSSQQALRSCISSEGKRKKKKNKKKVHFAKDVVDPRGNGEDFRRQHSTIVVGNSSSSSPNYKHFVGSNINNNKVRGMPANRMALYNGILRDRVVQRLAYSF